jgi:hypothetical protein
MGKLDRKLNEEVKLRVGQNSIFSASSEEK